MGLSLGLALFGILLPACQEQVPQQVNPPPINLVPPNITAVNPEQTLSPKRRKGMLLEALNFQSLDWEELSQMEPLNLGLVSFFKGTKKEIFIARQNMDYWIDQCEFNKAGVGFLIVFADKVTGPGGKDTDLAFDSMPRIFLIKVGLDTFFKQSAKVMDRDFEVSPFNRRLALHNYFLLDLNSRLAAMLCGFTPALRDMQEGNKITAEIFLTRYREIKEQILNGQFPSAVSVFDVNEFPQLN